MAVYAPELVARLWSSVDRRGPDECWPWTGDRDEDDYGRFRVGKRIIRAHQVVLEVKLGRKLKPGCKARHSCDHPWCCNPRHLSEGSHADNMRDMVEHGRSLRGERNPSAKLTAARVQQVKQLAAFNLAPRAIAARLGIPPRTVYLILQGVTWK